MNWVDAAIVGIVVLYALTGLRRGFLAGGAEIISLAIGFAVAIVLYRPIGSALATARGWPPGITAGVLFVVLWVTVQVVLSLVLRRWLKRLPEDTLQSPVNRVLGIIPAALKGLIAAALFATILSITRSGTAAADAASSTLARPMVAVVIESEKAAYNTFGDAIQEAQELYGPPGEVEGSRKLNFHTTDVVEDPQAEATMLEMVNAERVRRGLGALKPDAELQRVARQHSIDMLARGYFAHDTPEGISPFDRMHGSGITYRKAGENLALALTVETAHDRLMRSKGHRENILDPEFTKVGIGAIRTRLRGTMFTQDFTD